MPITVYQYPAFRKECKRLGVDDHTLKRFRIDYFKKQKQSSHALQAFKLDQRDALAQMVVFEELQLVQREDSNTDGATKLLFRTTDGALIESVILRIDSGRTSFCVSSQVGCPVKCRFCATGQMAQVRSLTISEILDQIVQANQLLASEMRYIRNVVFMGMGEPFFNQDNVHRAVEALTSAALFNLSERHVIVSTVGIPNAMVKFAQHFPRVRLALSLHSAEQEVREKLIPLASRFSIAQLRQTLEQVNTIQQQSVMVEYLMLQNLTDTESALEALDDFLRGLDVHINLIPFHAIDERAELQGSTQLQREAFANVLKNRGYKTTLRYSLGQDIEAACGQLARKQIQN